MSGAARRPLFLEDLAPGQRFGAGPLTVTTEDIVAFAQRYDPQPFHTDPATPGHPVLGGFCASGWHTAAITMRLITEALPLAWGIVGAGGEVGWHLPVRPGDALRLDVAVLETGASRSKPGQGWVRLRMETRNQDGAVVQSLLTRLIVPRRTSTA